MDVNICLKLNICIAFFILAYLDREANLTMSHKIERNDFYKSGLYLAFVPQTSNGEVSILIPAKRLFHQGKYYESRGHGVPAKLVEWSYPWPVEEGFARLRLSEMNNNDGKTYCNFNMNKGNLLDYEKKSGYMDGYYDKALRVALETNEKTRKTVNNLVDMSSGMIHMDGDTNCFSFDIWNAIVEGDYEIVQTRKFVFCIMPNLPSELKALGVKDMTDTKVSMYHHAEKRQDMIRIGWKNGQIKVPCVDGGGLSNICFYIDGDYDYESTFGHPSEPPLGAATEPANVSVFSLSICPYMYLNHFSLDQIYVWAKMTWNRYLESRGCEPLEDKQFAEMFHSITDLYNEY